MLAVQEQAKVNADKARGVINLYADLERRVLELTHSQFAVPLLDLMFEKPVFTVPDFKDKPGMPTYPMITNLLNRLKGAGIIHVVRHGSGRRPQILALPVLINLCEGRQII